MKSSTKQSIFWAVSALLIAGVIFLLIYFSAGYLGNAVSNAYDPGRGETLPVSFGLFFSRPLYWKLTLAFLFVLAGLCISCIFRNAKNRILLTVGIEILCVLFVLASQWGVYGKIRWLDLLLCCTGLAAGAGISVFSNRFFRFLQQRYVNMPMHSRQRLEMILDALALGAVIHYAVFRFLQNSMFTFYYSDLYKSITLLLLVFLGGIRFLYIILIKFWQTAQPQRQSFLLLRCAFFISLSIPFFLVGWMHDYKMLFFLPFAALCLYDMDAGKVFRVFAFTIGTLLAATVLCCLAGAVKNVVMAEKGFTGSFGTINTTDFASYFSFLLVTAWCIIKSKKWYASVLFAVFSFAVSFFVFRLTNSRTVLTIGLLTVLLALWNCLEDNVHMKKKKLGWLSKGMDWVSVLAFPLIGAFTVFLVMSYGRQLPWAIQVNEALSGRLSVTWTPYQTYGIHPLGNSIDSMLGFGRTQMSWVLGYSYLDIAYAMLAIRYGWVITGIVAGLWMWMTARAIKSGQKRIALAMVIIAAHAFSEARFLDINYNIFLVMPFCSFSSDRDKVSLLQEQTEKQKLNWFPCIACAVLSGIVYLVLPTALSWLRTFFALMGWNSGTAA